jgi:nitrite reductase/ring-hydroxylating ferredoxin subunit
MSWLSDLSDPASVPDLKERVLAGEVVVVRGGLQRAGLLEPILQMSLQAVNDVIGPEAAAAVKARGFEKIHEIVPAKDIPRLTDEIYERITARAPQDLSALIPSIFRGVHHHYFETLPNVRFHIPFDATRSDRESFSDFSKKRGEGKLTAHGPHRDSWLDCPDNGVNVWIAIGRVQRGNGLTVYRKEYDGHQRYTGMGNIARDERLSEPLTFELEPGDFVLFHTDQLHGSALNYTDETRFVISYRITFDRPHFPNGHYHSYSHSGLANGPLRRVAKLPALLQPSYVRSFGERVMKKLRPSKPKRIDLAPANTGDPRGMRIGEIRPTDSKTCMARLSEDKFVTFDRRCPHQGADLAMGYVAEGRIVCPWHNLPFDPATGQSPCRSLRPLSVKTEVPLPDAPMADAQATASRTA